MFERANGQPITMKLTLTPRDLGTTTSGNVVGEIVGRDPSLPPVLVACHIDSWWNGTGAFDDGQAAPSWLPPPNTCRVPASRYERSVC